MSKEKPGTVERLLERYSERCGDGARDFLHELTTRIAREFRDYEHGFED